MPARNSQRELDPEIVTGVRPARRSPAEVAREFRALVSGGAELRPAGEGRDDPGVFLTRRYLPRHAVSLFGARFFLTDFRFEEGLNFFVAYVGLADAQGRIDALWPRIVYKDSTLVWRVGSHVIRGNGDDWIGKGDVRWVREGDYEHLYSDEDTTNLPYELQPALDAVSRRGEARRDDDAIRLVLRNAPSHRIRPYADFTAPRERAARRHRLNGGRPVASLTRRHDPRSLKFARGFEPDFAREPLEVARSRSRLYGGAVSKFRILSVNGLVQYQFVATPSHVWINPPQALTTELTSFGIRALHVPADDEIFVPGFEYHFVDEDGELQSQIPPGFAGEPSEVSPGRADASPWIEALPVIRAFRRRVLGERGRARR